MYQTLTFLHSYVRWFLLASLIYSIYISYTGYTQHRIFAKKDNAVRHWTATIAHIQLILGILLYVESPLIQYFWRNFDKAILDLPTAFFGIAHILLMLTSIVVLTIGSALTKRKSNYADQFKTMLIYYSIALLLIICAIPWPFSPLANRPYFR